MKNFSEITETQTTAAPKRRVSNVVSLTASALAFAAIVWIIVPAPSAYVWLWSVAASEWSFIFGALAVFGIAVAFLFGRGKIKIASVFLGTAALAISLYPFFSALRAAREQGVELSAKQYLFGFRSVEKESLRNTFTFATIDGRALELDVYSPPESVSKNGAGIVVVHGGAWNAGERSDFPQWNRWLARQGYTVFDIDYRLAPQPNFPAATGDVKCAVVWVKQNARQFNISPDKIVLLGRSAGAHLALLAAYSANDARLRSSCADENAAVNESVRAVVSFYAPTDLLWSYDNPANQSVIDGPKTLSNFLGGNPHEAEETRERFLLASPTERVGAQTPPTLLIHGGQDQLVRSENLYFLDEKLKQENVPHKTVFISYAQHGFDYNFNGWGAQIVEPVLLDFLRERVLSE